MISTSQYDRPKYGKIVEMACFMSFFYSLAFFEIETWQPSYLNILCMLSRLLNPSIAEIDISRNSYIKFFYTNL